MKLLVDMNLSPGWVAAIRSAGVEAVHWSAVGSNKTKDEDILRWARERGFVLLTHDLDPGAILAASGAKAPSVIILRMASLVEESKVARLLAALRAISDDLEKGAIVSVDEHRERVRILPIGRES
jgi:predicted nuclease of predicted toxin-antitoxin system